MTEPKNGSREAQYPIDSVTNAARVLLMLRSASELRVSDVAEQLGVARSTAHRLLNTLCSAGLLKKEDGARVYQVGPGLVEIGLAAAGLSDLRVEARPILQDLADETGETAHVITLHGTNILFLDGVEAMKHVVRAAARTGLMQPAHKSAAGKVLLADLSAAQLHSIYQPEDQAVRRVLRDLEEDLAATRAEGYATNFSESEPDLHAFAVPVKDRRGSTRAALSVSAPSHRLPAERMIELLPVMRRAALTLGSRL